MPNNTGRFWSGDNFSGTHVVYAATSHDMIWLVCDVEINSLMESDTSELRAHRKHLERKGKNVPKLREDMLHNEMVVVFGPKMTPKEAIQALELVARRISETGLLAGRTKSEGNFVFEAVNGKMTEC